MKKMKQRQEYSIINNVSENKRTLKYEKVT